VPIDSGATAFAWSPDGSHIALATSNGLVSLDVAKRTTVLLANIPIAPGSEIGWSPNGNWVHFTIEEAGVRTIEMVNVTYTNTFVRLGVSDQPGYWGR
jgi:Tol biopolymer transport system component